MIAFTTLFFLFSLSISGITAQEDQSPMMVLDWLVGEWTFEDVAVDGSYTERGTRNCEWVLHDQYIRCESHGVSNSGHERSYYFIVGYNSMDARFEMVGLTSSYPRQNLYIIDPSSDGHTLELVNHFWTANGLETSNNATISYNGSDRYVWQIRTGEVDPVSGRRAVGFIDTVTRTGR